MVSSHGTGIESSASKDDATLMDITQSPSGFSLKGQFLHTPKKKKWWEKIPICLFVFEGYRSGFLWCIGWPFFVCYPWEKVTKDVFKL